MLEMRSSLTHQNAPRSAIEIALVSQQSEISLALTILGISVVMISGIRLVSVQPEMTWLPEFIGGGSIAFFAYFYRNQKAEIFHNVVGICMIIAALTATGYTALAYPFGKMGSDGYGEQSIAAISLLFHGRSIRQQGTWTICLVILCLGFDAAFRGSNGVRADSILLLFSASAGSILAGQMISKILARGQTEIDNYYSEARTDRLTNLPNRKYFEEIYLREQQGVSRGGRAFLIGIIDVDHFKFINDKFGHIAGDKVLIQLAWVFAQALRKSDVVARWGGEEFCLLISDGNDESAASVVERLRLAVAAHKFEIAPKTFIDVTVSIGIASYCKGEPLGSIVGRADDALYRAKRTGRNRVTMAELA